MELINGIYRQKENAFGVLKIMMKHDEELLPLFLMIDEKTDPEKKYLILLHGENEELALMFDIEWIPLLKREIDEHLHEIKAKSQNAMTLENRISSNLQNDFKGSKPSSGAKVETLYT